MSQSQEHTSTTLRRRMSVSTAVGIAAERATLAARERELAQVRAAAQRLSADRPALAR